MPSKTADPLEYVANRRVRKATAKNNIALQRLKQKAQRRRDALDALAKQNEEEVAEKLRLASSKDPYVTFEKYFQYRDNPIGFCYDVLNIELTYQQEDIFRALVNPDNSYQVFVAASHGVGKSFMAAAAMLWETLCFPDSIVVSTAPTYAQVSDVLWRSVRDLNPEPWIMRGTHKPEYQVTDTWFGVGKSPSSGDAFQGLHAKGDGHQLLVLDECVGLEPFLWEALEGLNHENARILAICNPTSLTSQAYQIYLSETYRNLHISSLDHPNIQDHVDGKKIRYPGAITYAHFEKMLLQWSTNIEPEYKVETDVEWPPGSNKWRRPDAQAQSRLLGRWPSAGGDSFFTKTLSDRFLQEVFLHPGLEADYVKGGYDDKLSVGLDVSRMGDDLSVVAVRYDNEITELHRMGKLDMMELAQVVIDILDELSFKYDIHPEDIPLNIDTTGVGSGIADYLTSLNYAVNEVHYSARANDPAKYANTRTELYGDLAEQIKDGHIKLSKDLSDLTGVIRSQMLRGGVYGLDSKGRFLLQSKDLARKGGGSPDDLDAISLACRVNEPRLEAIVMEGW